jgi:hypothetical protein
MFAFLVAAIVQAEETKFAGFDYFFKPIPKTEFQSQKLGATHSVSLTDTTAVWAFKPTVSLPMFKIARSARDSAKLDVSFLAGTAGGLTLQHTIQKDSASYADYSFSVLAILTGVNITSTSAINMGVGISANFLNNLIQIGVGYDCGQISREDKFSNRFFAMMSLGINLTE